MSIKHLNLYFRHHRNNLFLSPVTGVVGMSDSCSQEPFFWQPQRHHSNPQDFRTANTNQHKVSREIACSQLVSHEKNILSICTFQARESASFHPNVNPPQSESCVNVLTLSLARYNIYEHFFILCPPPSTPSPTAKSSSSSSLNHYQSPLVGTLRPRLD